MLTELFSKLFAPFVFWGVYWAMIFLVGKGGFCLAAAKKQRKGEGGLKVGDVVVNAVVWHVTLHSLCPAGVVVVLWCFLGSLVHISLISMLMGLGVASVVHYKMDRHCFRENPASWKLSKVSETTLEGQEGRPVALRTTTWDYIPPSCELDKKHPVLLKVMFAIAAFIWCGRAEPRGPVEEPLGCRVPALSVAQRKEARAVPGPPD